MLRKNEIELLARMERAGMKRDDRQSGWPLTFSTFAICNWTYGEFLGKLCNEATEKFIAAAPALHFECPLQGILFSPILITHMPPKRQLTILHQRADMWVGVKADLNPRMWEINNSRSRRTAFYRALSEGIQQIREDWISPDQKDSLVSIFRR